MAFPLAVLDEVKRVAAGADRPFAVGYRLIPEEIHGKNVGFTLEDTLQLVDRLAARGDELAMTVADRLHDLDLPAGLITWYTGSRRAILPPLPGIEQYEAPNV